METPPTTRIPLSGIKQRLTPDELEVLEHMLQTGSDPAEVEKYWVRILAEVHQVIGLGEPSEAFLEQFDIVYHNKRNPHAS